MSKIVEHTRVNIKGFKSRNLIKIIIKAFETNNLISELHNLISLNYPLVLPEKSWNPIAYLMIQVGDHPLKGAVELILILLINFCFILDKFISFKVFYNCIVVHSAS
jgi:hypothetical protein